MDNETPHLIGNLGIANHTMIHTDKKMEEGLPKTLPKFKTSIMYRIFLKFGSHTDILMI